MYRDGVLMTKQSKSNEYGNHSISSLKGADRVRLRPGVIFGSDGIEGCQQSVFEILSNSIDEATYEYNVFNKIRKAIYPRYYHQVYS